MPHSIRHFRQWGHQKLLVPSGGCHTRLPYRGHRRPCCWSAHSSGKEALEKNQFYESNMPWTTRAPFRIRPPPILQGLETPAPQKKKNLPQGARPETPTSGHVYEPQGASNLGISPGHQNLKIATPRGSTHHHQQQGRQRSTILGTSGGGGGRETPLLTLGTDCQCRRRSVHPPMILHPLVTVTAHNPFAIGREGGCEAGMHSGAPLHRSKSPQK